jgi:glycosyltransferase involved in cell wall biosynthesis
MMMKQPKVSIVMNCLNGEAYLKEAIDSVYAQTFQDWEIIFWDNLSTDCSPEIARQYDERLRYFRAEKKTSLGEGRRQAFMRANGEFTAILDVDDLWLPQKLEKQLPLFEGEASKVGIVVSNSMYFNEEGDQYDCFSRSSPDRGYVFGHLLAENFMASQTILFRTSALKSLEYTYDGEFTMVCDYDITLRIAAKFKVDYCDEVLAKWRIHAQSETSKKKHLFAIENKKMISKLTQKYPELLEEHREKFEHFEWLVNLQIGLDAWQVGNVKKAKSYFVKCRYKNAYSCVAYIGTILFPFRLPTEIFEFARKLRRAIKEVKIN